MTDEVCASKRSGTKRVNVDEMDKCSPSSMLSLCLLVVVFSLSPSFWFIPISIKRLESFKMYLKQRKDSKLEHTSILIS